MSTMPVGKCGIFCGACRLYVVEKCKGCIEASLKKAACSVYKCASKKNLDSCGKCDDFPCLEHYSSNQVFAKKKLLDWKKREIAANLNRKA